MGDTSIQWTNKTWSPLRGCSEISPGCAATLAYRFSGPGQPYEGLVKKLPNGKVVWTGKIRTVPEKLPEPLHWRKPAMVFVNSMSDLFHEDVPDDFIEDAFFYMACCPQHTFQVLTKRAERMRSVLTSPGFGIHWPTKGGPYPKPADWHAEPLPNVWMGVSVEDQKRADERIPHLLKTPAAVRFLSCEPLLGPLDLSRYLSWHGSRCPLRANCSWSGSECPQCGFENARIHWVIVGGESGPGARPCDVAWIRSIQDQCRVAGVPVFVKQLGANVTGPHSNAVNLTTLRLKDRKGGDMSEWPEDLRVRQMPVTAGGGGRAAEGP